MDDPGAKKGNMTDLKQPCVSLGDISLSLGDWLVSLRRQGRLRPLLSAAVIEQLLVSRAEQAGLTVSTERLQQAADVFRRQQGLSSAARFQAWLAEQGRSLLDFEDSLERELRIDQLKDHLTRDRITAHFAANQSAYAGAALRLILTSREDQARELLTQVREEGRDFAELAREHSLHPSRSQGGLLGLVRRRQLPPAIAEAVFAARQGDFVGPLAAVEGFHLFLVESLAPAELNAPTRALIRQELFDAWLADTLRNVPLKVPLLDVL
jgi:peptidylprolyl isomerase